MRLSCLSAGSALPPPLRGRAGEGGEPQVRCMWSPTPNPSRKGEGSYTERVYRPSHFGGRFSENAFGPSI